MHRAALDAVVFLAMLALAPSSAVAQAEVRTTTVSAYGRFGFAGDLDVFADTNVIDAHGTSGLEPAAGFGLRAETVVLDFLSVGGLFEATTYQASNTIAGVEFQTDRRWMFDLDAYAKARWLFELTPELFLEPYALVPFGLTLGALTNLSDRGDRVWPGWSTGILGGVTLLSSMGLGGFVELGWRHHEVYTSETVVGVDTHVSDVFNQLAVDVGISYAFR